MVQAHQPWLRRVVALLSPSAVHVITAATLQLHLLVDPEEQGKDVRSAVLILTRPLQGDQQAVRAVRRRLVGAHRGLRLVVQELPEYRVAEGRVVARV
jgi:hypothetical protein